MVKKYIDAIVMALFGLTMIFANAITQNRWEIYTVGGLFIFIGAAIVFTDYLSNKK